jgi:hypothetical protein
MKKTVYECACGQQRKESNHWFLLFHYEGFITLHKWRDDLVDSPNAEHICGPGCLAKAIDAWANPKLSVFASSGRLQTRVPQASNDRSWRECV